MFSSFFSTFPPDAQNLDPVSSRYDESHLLGTLTPKDTEWAIASGFSTETQVFYTVCDDGTFLMCQLIHSSVGLWYPQIHFTSRIYNEKKNISIWRSINVTNFTTPPPRLDKRSCKADQFSITHKSETDGGESYLVNVKLDDKIQISLNVTRPATIPGWKIGNDEKGGFSYLGPDPAKPDGYVVHRFWPRYNASGHIITNGQAQEVNGHGMFVHAIQGMRPDSIASRWNFAHFQSNQHDGVSAIMMEFTTTDEHGKKGKGTGNVKVNIGSLVVGGKLAAVTAQTHWPGEAATNSTVSKATHSEGVKDKDTGYSMPSSITFEWAGPSVVPEKKGAWKANMTVDLGNLQKPRGLIEKVDVLGEIPALVKTAVSLVSGTKPHMYQWYNPSTLEIQDPEGNKISAEGDVYMEATFISDK
ncbi:oxidative stress survival, Svf1-like protein [Flagelloscypha sp. PMI_526]|nr:oxidative stress survival, Svf1-like protein [Flagelloscypha sp. PMI_526]